MRAAGDDRDARLRRSQGRIARIVGGDAARIVDSDGQPASGRHLDGDRNVGQSPRLDAVLPRRDLTLAVRDPNLPSTSRVPTVVQGRDDSIGLDPKVVERDVGYHSPHIQRSDLPVRWNFRGSPIGPARSLHVGDDRQSSRGALAELRSFLNDRTVFCRAKTRLQSIQGGQGVRGAARLGQHVRALVERHQRDALADRRLADRCARPLQCLLEAAGGTHAEGPVDGDDERASSTRRAQVRPSKCSGKQEQGGDAGGEKQQILQPPATRSLDRRTAQHAYSGEWDLGGDVASQEVQDDREGDRDGADQKRGIEERHPYFLRARAAR